MRKEIFMTMVLCILLMPVVALAIDPTDDVKVTPVLKASASWNGDQIIYPPGKAEVTGMLVEVAPGRETGWHSHTVPSFAYMLEGTLEVSLKDGRTKRLQAGEGLAEVVNKWHNGRNVGNTPVRIVVFYIAAEGAIISIKAPADASGKEKTIRK